jgi:hypothetical protein
MNVAIKEKRKISWSVISLILLLCGSMLMLKNGVYLFTCMSTLILIFLLLWRNNRPGVLLFAFVMQWTQIIAYVVWMNVRGVDINFLSPHADIAVVVSCLGLLAMAAIVSRGVKNLPVPSRQKLAEEASRINERKILFLYLGSTLFLSSIGFILGASSGLTQILVTLSSLKWIFFLVYGYVAWLNKKNRLVLGIMIVYEFATSLYSYFSSFKQVILIVIILAITFIATIKLRQIFYSLIVMLLLGFMGVTWSAIKSDYRKYVSGGQKQQVVVVSREDALSKIGEEVSGLTAQRYQFAIMITLYRVQYIFHLARTMDRVPKILPHENGKLWASNLGFILLPRILFPNKPIFDATQKTNKYTGLNYGGYTKGTSFGIGYFADCYIDFGYIGMVIPLALIALFVTMIYRVLYNFSSLNILFRYALINVCLFNFTSFESDGIIVIGRLLITFLVFWAISRTIFPRIQRWLYKK